MEVLVEAEEFLHVTGGSASGLALQDFPQAGDAGRIHGKIPQGCTLDGLPDELGFGDARQVHQGDERSYLGEDLNQTLFPNRIRLSRTGVRLTPSSCASSFSESGSPGGSCREMMRRRSVSSV